MDREQAIALLEQIRDYLAELYRKTPGRNQAQRRFIARFSRTLLVMIGYLKGEILNDTDYESLVLEFDDATGRLEKLRDNLVNVTHQIEKSNEIITGVVSAFNQITPPA